MAVEETESSEGENYFVSMTDMMVGMLFIFIILLMSFALVFRDQTDTQQTTTAEQQAKIDQATRLAETLQEIQHKIEVNLEELRQANQLRLKLLREVADLLRRENIVVELTKAGDVLRLTENAIRFDPDKSVLRPDALNNIGKISVVLAQVLPRYAPCAAGAVPPSCRGPTEAAIETVFVEGHTDETGSDERNWTLSAERAANTYRELTAKAPGLRDIANRRSEQILSISGYSATRRLDPSGTRDAWARNRRIDLRFVMDTDPEAGLKEIKALVVQMKLRIDTFKGGAP